MPALQTLSLLIVVLCFTFTLCACRTFKNLQHISRKNTNGSNDGAYCCYYSSYCCDRADLRDNLRRRGHWTGVSVGGGCGGKGDDCFEVLSGRLLLVIFFQPQTSSAQRRKNSRLNTAVYICTIFCFSRIVVSAERRGRTHGRTDEKYPLCFIGPCCFVNRHCSDSINKGHYWVSPSDKL